MIHERTFYLLKIQLQELLVYVKLRFDFTATNITICKPSAKLSRLQSCIGLATVLRIIEGRVPNKEGDFEDKRVNSANYGINIMGCEAVIDESVQPSILYKVNQKKALLLTY